MWTQKVSDFLIANGVINEDEREIYEFGLEQLPFEVLNFGSVVFIGIVTGMFLESILFTIVFMTVRQYAGGYHSSTRLGCYILSLMVILLGLWGIREESIHFIIMIVLTVLFGGIIFLICPVENDKKKLDSQEKKVYRKKARMAICLFLIIELAAGYFKLNKIVCCILYAFMFVCILLLIELGKKKVKSIRK